MKFLLVLLIVSIAQANNQDSILNLQKKLQDSLLNNSLKPIEKKKSLDEQFVSHLDSLTKLYIKDSIQNAHRIDSLNKWYVAEDWGREILTEANMPRTDFNPCMNPRYLHLKKIINWINASDDIDREYDSLKRKCEGCKSCLEESEFGSSSLFGQLGTWHIVWGIIDCAGAIAGTIATINTKNSEGWVYAIDISALCVGIWEFNMGCNLEKYRGSKEK